MPRSDVAFLVDVDEDLLATRPPRSRPFVATAIALARVGTSLDSCLNTTNREAPGRRGRAPGTSTPRCRFLV